MNDANNLRNDMLNLSVSECVSAGFLLLLSCPAPGYLPCFDLILRTNIRLSVLNHACPENNHQVAGPKLCLS